MTMPMRADDDRIQSQEESARIIHQAQTCARGGGTTSLRVTSWWNGELRWARNRVHVASDRRNITVRVKRSLNGGTGVMHTNQWDNASLQALVQAAERIALLQRNEPLPDMVTHAPDPVWPATTTWSTRTSNVTTADRGTLARLLVDGAEAHQMLSSGYLEMRLGAVAETSNQEEEDEMPFAGRTPGDQKGSPAIRYTAYTQAQCSMTVRHPRGTGSGWAGLSSYDWGVINGPVLAAQALDKCLKSIDPVRIEPGRYTVVLEAQAVCDLLELLVYSFSRMGAEIGTGPFASVYDESLYMWRTKLGLKVIDERITIAHDPGDPDLGVLPIEGLLPITWIRNGILETLEYERNKYAIPDLNENAGALGRFAYRMSGGSTSVNEMITTTKRGLLITRFSNLMGLDDRSLLATGVTRDGLWLIENGVISKAVKNMRITESPLFVLNQIEQLGIPVPVFRPNRDPGLVANYSHYGLTPAIVPPLKVNDFSFTALSDAI